MRPLLAMEIASAVTLGIAIVGSVVSVVTLIWQLRKNARDDRRAERQDDRLEDTGERETAKFWREDSEAKERVVARLTEQMNALQETVEQQGVLIQQLSEKHKAEIDAMEERHRTEIRAKDAEIARWTRKVDQLELRVQELEGKTP